MAGMDSRRGDSTDEYASSLARRVAAVPDPQMRVAYVRQLLTTELDAARAVDLLLVVRTRAEAHEDDHAALLLAMSIALASPDLAEIRAQLRGIARARRIADLIGLAAPTSAVPPPNEELSKRVVPDFGVGRPLTLGERKSVARTRDRNLIARVFRDPDPTVIRILLGNPRITEDDVVRLCARRPAHSDILREVFLHARWSCRYRVRLALIRNPASPLEVALASAAHLTTQDARAVAASSELAPEVREACRRLFRASIAPVH